MTGDSNSCGETRTKTALGRSVATMAGFHGPPPARTPLAAVQSVEGVDPITAVTLTHRDRPKPSAVSARAASGGARRGPFAVNY